MSAYAAYFLGSKSSVVYLETLQISHPAFTKTYWLVRNAIAGLVATLENGQPQAFDYYPLRLRPTGSADNLDQTIEVDLGDLGEVLPKEIDAIAAAGRMGTKPAVTYRAWRSDDLSAPIVGPLFLEMADLATKREGSTFKATAPSLNVNRTGEMYRVERFPMISGFL